MSAAHNRHNLVGQRFGELTVLSFHSSDGQNAFWVCSCSCGKVSRPIRATCLLRGTTSSCGCLQKKLVSARFKGNAARLTHGFSKTLTYRSWIQMIQRCTNPKAPNWKYYGGRGINVCDRWLSLHNFLADMGPRPSGKSIDRFPDNDGNYEPGNCRWATQSEQMLNTRLTSSGNTAR